MAGAIERTSTRGSNIAFGDTLLRLGILTARPAVGPPSMREPPGAGLATQVRHREPWSNAAGLEQRDGSHCGWQPQAAPVADPARKPAAGGPAYGEGVPRLRRKAALSLATATPSRGRSRAARHVARPSDLRAAFRSGTSRRGGGDAPYRWRAVDATCRASVTDASRPRALQGAGGSGRGVSVPLSRHPARPRRQRQASPATCVPDQQLDVDRAGQSTARPSRSPAASGAGRPGRRQAAAAPGVSRGRWLTFATPRTDARGRWQHDYRFTVSGTRPVPIPRPHPPRGGLSRTTPERHRRRCGWRSSDFDPGWVRSGHAARGPCSDT